MVEIAIGAVVVIAIVVLLVGSMKESKSTIVPGGRPEDRIRALEDEDEG